MSGFAPGAYLIKLKVTDNTALSYPSSGLPDQTSTDTAGVTINATCPCITNLAAMAQMGRVTLMWSATVASQYKVYRKLATDASYPALPIGSTTATTYIDTTVTNGVAYHYVVKPVDPNPPNAEWCTSNQVAATPPTTRPR
jgi:fibronectin type 3 domain-containing protein